MLNNLVLYHIHITELCLYLDVLTIGWVLKLVDIPTFLYNGEYAYIVSQLPTKTIMLSSIVKMFSCD